MLSQMLISSSLPALPATWQHAQFFDKQNARNGENRYATMLTFLADVEEGGETVFPKIPLGPNKWVYHSTVLLFIFLAVLWE